MRKAARWYDPPQCDCGIGAGPWVRQLIGSHALRTRFAHAWLACPLDIAKNENQTKHIIPQQATRDDFYGGQENPKHSPALLLVKIFYTVIYAVTPLDLTTTHRDKSCQVVTAKIR